MTPFKKQKEKNELRRKNKKEPSRNGLNRIGKQNSALESITKTYMIYTKPFVS